MLLILSIFRLIKTNIGDVSLYVIYYDTYILYMLLDIGNLICSCSPSVCMLP